MMQATCAECSKKTPVRADGHVSRYLYETAFGPANLCSRKCERAYNGEGTFKADGYAERASDALGAPSSHAADEE